MADQRARGIESGHLSAHARNNSENEPLGETAVENRTLASEDGPENDLSGAPRCETGTHVRTSSSAPVASRSLPPARGLSMSPHRSSSPESRFSPKPQPLEPPVTKATLSELDVHKIVHNPKLRHDINFDPELHFRPNLDGDRGRKKQDKANQFWNALSEQLILFVTNREEFQTRYPNGKDWCLPLLLSAVKEIIQTLVPQRDRDILNDGLNVDLIMQQFNKGIADLEKLASWLSGILKLHCAPMRDEWVDEMYNELSNGNRNNDIAELVKGMRTLLSVLEAMKLDVANHQIRCLRPVLIEDTVHFEQRFFVKKIQGGKLNVDAARTWYQNAKTNASTEFKDPRCTYAQAFGDTAVFFEATTKLILPSTPVEVPNSNECPNTFVFDEDRLVKLRSDLHDTICLEICMRQFEELEHMSSFDIHLNFNAPQFSRPSSYVGSDSGSSSSSPRNSGYMGARTNVDTADVRTRSRELYNSLLALLQTAPPAPKSLLRWHGLSSSMALQILRYVHAPHITLGDLEEVLLRKLSHIKGDAFREVEACIHQRLLQELAKRVKDLSSLSGLGLFSAATTPRASGTQAPGPAQQTRRPEAMNVSGAGREPREEGGIEDMATRLAHLGLLHWRVWGQIAYTSEESVDMAL